MSKLCRYGNGNHYQFGDKYENVFNKYYMGRHNLHKQNSNNTEMNHWHVANNYYANPYPFKEVIYYKPMLQYDDIDQSGLECSDHYSEQEHDDEQLSLVGFMDTNIPLPTGISRFGEGQPKIPFQNGEQLYCPKPGVPFFLTKTDFLENNIPKQSYTANPVLYNDQPSFPQPAIARNHPRTFPRARNEETRQRQWSDVYREPGMQKYYKQRKKQINTPYNTEPTKNQRHHHPHSDGSKKVEVTAKLKPKRMKKQRCYKKNGGYGHISNKEQEEKELSDFEYSATESISNDQFVRPKSDSAFVKTYVDQSMATHCGTSIQTDQLNDNNRKHFVDLYEYRDLVQTESDMYNNKLITEQLENLALEQNQEYYDEDAYLNEVYDNDKQFINLTDENDKTQQVVQCNTINVNDYGQMPRTPTRNSRVSCFSSKGKDYSHFRNRQTHPRRKEILHYSPELEPFKEESIEYLHAPNITSDPNRQFTVAYDSKGNRYYGSTKIVNQLIPRLLENPSKQSGTLKDNVPPENKDETKLDETHSLNIVESERSYEFQKQTSLTVYVPTAEEQAKVVPRAKIEYCTKKKPAVLRAAKFHDVRLEDVCDSNSTVDSSVQSSREEMTDKSKELSSCSIQKVVELKQDPTHEDINDSPNAIKDDEYEEPVLAKKESSSSTRSGYKNCERGRRSVQGKPKMSRLKRSPAREQFDVEELEKAEVNLETIPVKDESQPKKIHTGDFQISESFALEENDEILWISAIDVDFRQEEMRSITASLVSEPLSSITCCKEGNDVFSLTSDGSKLLSANTAPSGKTISSRSSTKSRLNSEVVHMMSRLEEIQCILKKKNDANQKSQKGNSNKENTKANTFKVLKSNEKKANSEKQPSSSSDFDYFKKQPLRRRSEQHTNRKKVDVRVPNRVSRSLPETNTTLLNNFKKLVTEKEENKLLGRLSLSNGSITRKDMPSVAKNSISKSSCSEIVLEAKLSKPKCSINLKNSELNCEKSVSKQSSIETPRFSSSTTHKPSQQFIDNHRQSSSSISTQYSDATNIIPEAPASIVNILPVKSEAMVENSETRRSKHQIKALLDNEDIDRLEICNSEHIRRNSETNLTKLKKKKLNKKRQPSKVARPPSNADQTAGTSKSVVRSVFYPFIYVFVFFRDCFFTCFRFIFYW